MCPDIPPSEYNIQLQGYVGFRKKSDFITFSLKLGTCADLAQWTLRTDCEPADYVYDNIGYMGVYTKVLTQFFNPKLKMQSEYYYYENALQKDVVISKSLSATLYRQSQFENWFYNFPLAPGVNYDEYDINVEDITTLNRTIAA